jgi:acetyltransferase-like isoleucine patch superfamily enzyme
MVMAGIFFNIWRKWKTRAEYYILCRGDNIRYLRRMGVRIGEGCFILNGAGSYPEPWLVEIGDHVKIANGVGFITHDGSSRLFRDKLPGSCRFGNRYGKIIVRDNSFIGVGSIVMPDVTIGPNSIVGAHSVVTKDVPPGTVFAGNPARLICTFEEYIDKYKKKMIPLTATDWPSLRRELTMKLWGEER